MNVEDDRLSKDRWATRRMPRDGDTAISPNDRKIMQLKALLVARTTESDDLRRQLRSAKVQIESKTARLAAAEKRLDDTLLEVDKLEQRLDSRDAQLASLQDRIRKMTREKAPSNTETSSGRRSSSPTKDGRRSKVNVEAKEASSRDESGLVRSLMTKLGEREKQLNRAFTQLEKLLVEKEKRESASAAAAIAEGKTVESLKKQLEEREGQLARVMIQLEKVLAQQDDQQRKRETVELLREQLKKREKELTRAYAQLEKLLLKQHEQGDMGVTRKRVVDPEANLGANKQVQAL